MRDTGFDSPRRSGGPCFAVVVGCAIAGAVAFAGAGPNARPTHSQSSATPRIEVLDQIGGAMNALALVDEPGVPFDGPDLGIFASDQHLFLLGFVLGSPSLSVFKAAMSSPPVLLSNLALDGFTHRLGGDGERVYVGGDRLTAIDVSSPTTPRVFAAWKPTEGEESGAARSDSIMASSSWIFSVSSLESGGKQQFFRLSDSSPSASR